MAAVDGACRLEQGKEDGFLVTVPKNGRKIDLRRLTDALRAALATGTLEPVTCTYEVVEAKPVDFDAFAETYATAKNASYNAAADQVEEGTVQVTFDADASPKAGGSGSAGTGNHRSRPDPAAQGQQGGAGEGAVPGRAGQLHHLRQRRMGPHPERPQGGPEYLRHGAQLRRPVQL